MSAQQPGQSPTPSPEDEVLIGEVINRAGIVAFNRAGQVLLITAVGKDDVWVFPKGHIEIGEESFEAAERECAEEAGIKVIVDSPNPIATTSYEYKGEAVTVEWWTGLATGYAAQADARKAFWVSHQEALELLSFEELKLVLKAALCLPVEVTDGESDESGGSKS